MSHADQYTMLLTGLPYHPSLFAAKQTPLSRIRLDQRLRVLEQGHAEQLRLIEDTIRWRNLQTLDTDKAVVERTRSNLLRLESDFLRDLVRERLELRTLIAAMRRRERGDPAPGERELWGFGRWLPMIRSNWNDPVFRLARAFPWAPKAHKLIQAGDALALERLLLGLNWDQLGQAREAHYFDFEAVVIYVLRWDLIARWTGYNASDAARRFAGLVEAGLGDSAALFD